MLQGGKGKSTLKCPDEEMLHKVKEKIDDGPGGKVDAFIPKLRKPEIEILYIQENLNLGFFPKKYSRE